MRLIYVIGCCLFLAVFVSPSEGGLFGWFGKKNDDDDDIQVGLVKPKSPAQQKNSNTPKPQDGPSKPQGGPSKLQGGPSNQQGGSSNPQGGPLKPAGQGTVNTRNQNRKPGQSPPRTETTVASTPVKPKGLGPPPPIKVDPKVMQDPKAKAAVAAGATAVAAAQKQIDKNQKTTTKLEKQVNDLKKDLSTKNRDESLDDLIENLLDVTKKRFRIKIALVIYAIINFILYIAQYAGSFITPPVGKTLYFVDLVAKNIIRKPLDDYYAEYQNANAEVVAKYIQKHPEEFKNVKVGKRIKIKTPKGEYSFRVLKTRPGQSLNEQDLHIVDQHPIKAFRTIYALKK